MPVVVLFTLYLLFFLDLGGIVLAYVLFPPLVLSGEMAVGSMETRNVLIGLLMACYPLANVIGAPLLGELSDRFGRKPMLLLASVATAFCFAFSAFSISIRSIWLLFLSRVLSGLAAGNLTVAQATVAEEAPIHLRARLLTLFSLVGGLAWTFSPLLADLLSDNKLVSWFTLGTPLLAWALLFLLCALSLAIFLHEERRPRLPEATFGALGRVLVSSPATHPLFVTWLMLFGWMMYQGYLSTYLIERFQFTENLEALAYSVSSVAWAFGGALASVLMIRRHMPSKFIFIPLCIVSLSVFSYLFVGDARGVWPVMCVANFFASLAYASMFALFAELVAKDELGRVYGCANGGMALGSAAGPALAGVLVNIWIQLPYLLASCILGVSALYYFGWKRKVSS